MRLRRGLPRVRGAIPAALGVGLAGLVTAVGSPAPVQAASGDGAIIAIVDGDVVSIDPNASTGPDDIVGHVVADQDAYPRHFITASMDDSGVIYAVNNSTMYMLDQGGADLGSWKPINPGEGQVFGGISDSEVRRDGQRIMTQSTWANCTGDDVLDICNVRDITVPGSTTSLGTLYNEQDATWLGNTDTVIVNGGTSYYRIGDDDKSEWFEDPDVFGQWGYSETAATADGKYLAIGADHQVDDDGDGWYDYYDAISFYRVAAAPPAVPAMTCRWLATDLLPGVDGDEETIEEIAFSPDGKQLAFVLGDYASGALYIVRDINLDACTHGAVEMYLEEGVEHIFWGAADYTTTSTGGGGGGGGGAGSGNGFQALPAPVRLLDTRAGGTTKDGQFAGVGRVPAGDVLKLPVAGRGGVPGDASSVVLNVTAVEPSAGGYLTVFPCGEPQPNTSNVNYVPGQVVPNAVIAKVGADGAVCIYSYADTDLLVDVAGSLPSSALTPLAAPVRLLDTRAGGTTKDGQFAGVGRVPAGQVLKLPVAGRGGVAGDASSVVLNVTAVEPSAGGYLTVFPCGEPQPNTSNVNYVPGQVVPNAVIAKVGADGAVCIYSYADTDVLVDVAASFSPSALSSLAAPVRLLDTRAGGTTKDGQFAGVGRVPAGQVLELPVAGRGGVAGDASSVVLNVTAVEPSAGGYLTVFPCGEPQPNTSNVNYTAGQVVPNAVIAKVGAGGAVCIYSYADTDVLVDVAASLS